MNNEELTKYNELILRKYDTSRFFDAVPIDCVMPGYFGGSDVMFIAQNPGQLKEDVEGDQLYLRAYEKKEYDKLGEFYIKALKSSRGTYGTFINDIYGADWSRISLTNVYKCPFVNNKLPAKLPERENKILLKQIQLVDPKIIVSTGAEARKFLIRQDWDIRDRVMFCQHPAYSKRTGQYDEDVEKYSKELELLLKEHGLSKPV